MMGACFHIAGVYCDNCKMGSPMLHPLTGTPLTGDLAGPYPPPLATAASLDALRAEVEGLKKELKASNETIDMLYERSARFAAQADKHEAEATRLKDNMATIRRLAIAGLDDEAVSEMCALDDICSITQGLPIDEEP